MINFRAWDKGTELMNDITVIDLENEEIYYHHWRYGHSEAIPISDIELLQSTGLFDLDGNEIYIGDILKVEDEYTQVVFHEDNTTYGIYLEDKEGGGNPISDYSTRISLNHIKGTIEGNIYQHLHLLEE
ncbi:YopX family protein [Staphylococcus nepalensis]|uniref:YopX family protein n=1 Tax=Staphylococcus nepalensis TaxID=214473 RepID=UPI00383A7298